MEPFLFQTLPIIYDVRKFVQVGRLVLCGNLRYQEFVALATGFPFGVEVGNDRYRANGKSFMEMFCLDFRHPLIARVECSQVQRDAFREALQRFLI